MAPKKPAASPAPELAGTLEAVRDKSVPKRLVARRAPADHPEGVQAIVAGESKRLKAVLLDLSAESPARARRAAKIVDAILQEAPATLASGVEDLAAALRSPDRRVIETAGHALTAIVKVAPARVAKHLASLSQSFPELSEAGREGIVRTFEALCAASVAYQRRLEPVLCQALAEADAKTFVRWVELVLPTLKGEPHANARAVVEARLVDLPKVHAKRVAAFLGIKFSTRSVR